jgi:hypothetical protein
MEKVALMDERAGDQPCLVTPSRLDDIHINGSSVGLNAAIKNMSS